MARRKKPKLLRKILIIGGCLMLAQVGFILYFQHSQKEVSIKEELESKVKALPGATAQRREEMRVQLAVDDFRSREGRLPKTLQELVPTYFDSIPKDPTTNQAISYTVEGNRFFVGVRKPASSSVANLGSQTEAEKVALIASLDAPDEAAVVPYDPTGKRDPFRPFDMSTKFNVDCKVHPLACYDLGELRLSAVLLGFDEPTASVQDATGRGHMVRKGAKIGLNGGEIVEILPDRLRILEAAADITGEIKNTVKELILRQDAASKVPPPQQGRGRRR